MGPLPPGVLPLGEALVRGEGEGEGRGGEGKGWGRDRGGVWGGGLPPPWP